MVMNEIEDNNKGLYLTMLANSGMQTGRCWQLSCVYNFLDFLRPTASLKASPVH